MRPPWTAALLATALQTGPALSSAIPDPAAVSSASRARSAPSAAHSQSLQGSYWYDWGWYGPYPRNTYQSFGAQGPRPNQLKTDTRCAPGFTFIEPRGVYVETPGPIMLDNGGNLVWMQTLWGQAMDVKVQQFKGDDYITFWHGTDNGTFGEGYYIMLDSSYEVARKVLPVGEGLTGDLHEFRITEHDTALMTIYNKQQADMTAYGIDEGWIFDSIFQEVDLDSGELLFEWRASDAFPVHDSQASLFGLGASPSSAFDFFHINSIDTDLDGNYIISSRYFCSITCISRIDGSVLWELGGPNNAFQDLSDGRATDFTWNHHAAWVDKKHKILTVFDNGSWGKETTADYSRGLMIQIDTDKMTATLVHAYLAPQKLLSPSQGSVQALPNDNVLVGWGHTPAWTEYTRDGEVLCDTHIAPLWFANFGWAKNYRTFKYPWVGRPSQPPDVAMRPGQNALYVSWNGATEVRSWQLQTGAAEDASFEDAGDAVPKTTFETRLDVKPAADDFVRVVALDAAGAVLGHSNPVSKRKRTVTPLLEAPSRGLPPTPPVIFAMSLGATVVLVWLVYMLRFPIRNALGRILRTGRTYKYQQLPTKD